MSTAKVITLEEMKKNSQLKLSDIQSLKEWCEKQPHLPKIEDSFLALCLHTNYYRVEPTKKTIENYYTFRTHLPEFFCDRDPLGNKELRQNFKIIDLKKMASNISSIDKEIVMGKNIQKRESSAFMKTINNKNSTQNQMYTKTEGMELKWIKIIFIILLHLYFVYACFTFKFFENLKTTAWTYAILIASGFGVTGGAHRFWTHRSYKAKWPLRVILVILYSSAGMNDIYDWVRDHRVHHKYTDTDADPHNSNRGFFFSHVGWLMMKKHPEVIRKGREIDMSDILADPIVMFSCKYFLIFKFLFAFFLPVMVPVYVWNETFSRSLAAQMIRYIVNLNAAFSVNSVAHIWGSKPYNACITPTDNGWISIITGGEGWHNYHHVFPWDYKTTELWNSFEYNRTTKFIDFFAKIGWAYDLKQPSEELVKTVMMNNGDGTHHLWDSVPYPVS